MANPHIKEGDTISPELCVRTSLAYLVDFELGWDQSFGDLPSRMIHHQIELKIVHRAHDGPPMIFTVNIFFWQAMFAISCDASNIF